MIVFKNGIVKHAVKRMPSTVDVNINGIAGSAACSIRWIWYVLRTWAPGGANCAKELTKISIGDANIIGVATVTVSGFR